MNPDLIKDTVDGKIYGMPKESSSGYQAVYYNKKVMADCGITDPQPKTYQEFLDILKTVKEKGNGVVPFYQTNADNSVSYTHLDVYKRQALGKSALRLGIPQADRLCLVDETNRSLLPAIRHGPDRPFPWL